MAGSWTRDIIFVVCLIVVLARCQKHDVRDNIGKEFIIGFMENEKNGNTNFDLEIFITTALQATVNVTITAPRARHLNLSKRLSVRNGQVKKINVDRHFEHKGSKMDSKGILISASGDIVVYAVNKQQYSTDAFLGLPTDVLGTEYITVSFSPASKYTLILIVAVVNQTEVSILLPDVPGIRVNYNQKNYRRNDQINVTMDRFDSFQLHSESDLTGTRVKADKPIAVFSGNKKTHIRNGGSGDHLVEQLFPVNTWGKSFALVPIPHRTTGDVFRFISSKPNTSVSIEGLKNRVLFAENFTISSPKLYIERDYDSNMYSFVKANNPILVAQFVKTQTGEHDLSDPAMVLIPPVEQYSADYTFVTPKYSLGSYINYVMFVVAKADKNGLLLNGVSLPTNTVYHDIPNSSPALVGGFIKIDEGMYSLKHSSPVSVFGAILFGRQDKESYAFPVGLRMTPIDPDCYLTNMKIADGIDNDCDGYVDEEKCVTMSDEDNDGLFNEDCAAADFVTDGGIFDNQTLIFDESYMTSKDNHSRKLPFWFQHLEMSILPLMTIIIVGGIACVCFHCCLVCKKRSNDENNEKRIPKDLRTTE